MRGGLTSAGQGKTEGSIRNQRIPPQKTQSFKREKRSKNWLRRPFSGKMMSSNGDSDHKLEQVLAVAAATYVVNSIAKQNIRDQKKSSAGVEPSLNGDKSRKDDKSSSISKSGTISKQFSGKGSRKGSATDGTEIRRAPSFRKSLTLADHLGSTAITSPSSSSKPDMLSGRTESAAPKSDHPSITPRAVGRSDKPSVPEIEPKQQTATRPETEQTKAEAWLKDEMAKIKERYMKLKNTILAWEEKKRKKTKNKLHRTESGLERKRERALLKFKNEMDHIEQGMDGARESQRNDELKAKEETNTIILVLEEKKKKAKNKLNSAERGLKRKREQALLKFKKEMVYIEQAADGAREQAEASQRNDELKAKEKANIIRTTGEVPRTCICC